MAVTVVGSSAWAQGSVAIPAGAQAGDLMVALLAGHPGTLLSIDQGWTKRAERGADRYSGIATKVHSGSESAPTVV